MDALNVTIPELPPWTDEDVRRQVLFLVHRFAERRPRTFGEAIGLDDDLQVQVVGFFQGKVLPFSAEKDVVWRLGLGEEGFPGLRPSLEGAKVGDKLEVEVDLADDHPFLPARGGRAVMVVEILGADEVLEPSLEDAAFLRRAGCESVSDLFKRAVQELETERQGLLALGTIERVLAEVVKRAKVHVTPKQLAAELTATWEQEEGEVLEDLGLPEEDRVFSREAWLASNAIREHVANRLSRGMALAEIGRQEGIPVDAPDPDASARLARATGMSVLAAREMLGRPGSFAHQLAGHLRVLEHVLDKATIEFLPP